MHVWEANVCRQWTTIDNCQLAIDGEFTVWVCINNRGVQLFYFPWTFTIRTLKDGADQTQDLREDIIGWIVPSRNNDSPGLLSSSDALQLEFPNESEIWCWKGAFCPRWHEVQDTSAWHIWKSLPVAMHRAFEWAPFPRAVAQTIRAVRVICKLSEKWPATGPSFPVTEQTP